MEALPQRTKSDFAFMVKKISDTFYPDIDEIILINDNLNTHEYYAENGPRYRENGPVLINPLKWIIMQKFAVENMESVEKQSRKNQSINIS